MSKDWKLIEEKYSLRGVLLGWADGKEGSSRATARVRSGGGGQDSSPLVHGASGAQQGSPLRNQPWLRENRWACVCVAVFVLSYGVSTSETFMLQMETVNFLLYVSVFRKL